MYEYLRSIFEYTNNEIQNHKRKKYYHKVYTLFQANFKVSYEARYNVTEFIVLKHMHISIKKKKEQIITEYKFISCAFRKL